MRFEWTVDEGLNFLPTRIAHGGMGLGKTVQCYLSGTCSAGDRSSQGSLVITADRATKLRPEVVFILKTMKEKEGSHEGSD